MSGRFMLWFYGYDKDKTESAMLIGMITWRWPKEKAEDNVASEELDESPPPSPFSSSPTSMSASLS